MSVCVPKGLRKLRSKAFLAKMVETRDKNRGVTTKRCRVEPFWNGSVHELYRLKALITLEQGNTSVVKKKKNLRACLHGVGDPGLVGLVSFAFTLWRTQNKRNLPH